MQQKQLRDWKLLSPWPTSDFVWWNQRRPKSRIRDGNVVDNAVAAEEPDAEGSCKRMRVLPHLCAGRIAQQVLFGMHNECVYLYIRRPMKAWTLPKRLLDRRRPFKCIFLFVCHDDLSFDLHTGEDAGNMGQACLKLSGKTATFQLSLW